MKHELISLPFSKSALEPYMSAETLEYHYDKHHRAYVNTLNTLIEWTKHENQDLESIITSSDWKIFNNAAQIWNHNFLWDTLKVNGGEGPKWRLLDLINLHFWSLDKMKEVFKTESLSRFGSWWVWLVQKSDGLEIYSTPNWENPLTEWWEALLWLDVWEHAYYIDYRNDRGWFVDNFWNILDWDKVSERLSN